MQQILPYIYFGSIPGETSTQNTVNIYMIKYNDEALFIDSGYDTMTSRRFFEYAFEQYDIDPAKTKLFLTHYHIDHVGMAWWFEKQGVSIYMHKEEYSDARFGLGNSRMELCKTFGLHDSEIQLLHHRVFQTQDYQPCLFHTNPIAIGDHIDIGPYSFEIIPLFGHTRSHTGLYDRNSGILFGGDHVLKGISPVILTEKTDQHFLQMYYDNLDYVSSLFISHLLPSHGEILLDEKAVDAAIKDIRLSYYHLCETILLILEQATRPVTAYQIVSKIYHRQRMDMRRILGLRQYLMTQKILSCLEYMYDQEQINRFVSEDGVLYYWKQKTP